MQDSWHFPLSQRLRPTSHTLFLGQSFLLETQEKSEHWYSFFPQVLLFGWIQWPFSWQLPSGHKTLFLGQVILVGHKSYPIAHVKSQQSTSPFAHVLVSLHVCPNNMHLVPQTLKPIGHSNVVLHSSAFILHEPSWHITGLELGFDAFILEKQVTNFLLLSTCFIGLLVLW